MAFSVLMTKKYKATIELSLCKGRIRHDRERGWEEFGENVRRRTKRRCDKKGSRWQSIFIARSEFKDTLRMHFITQAENEFLLFKASAPKKSEKIYSLDLLEKQSLA
ncbi:MAG: hypothetical protein HC767_14260 [Akkermansiaceae bacterium]|nr:hypothetical protein [Akkermansiaceae bacterium]